MTVRWKPLIVLSALFLVVGVMGVVAISYALMPGKSSDLLALARSDWKAGHYQKSEIQFRRALQVAPKDAKIHAEMARMYADWASAQPAEKAKLRPSRLHALSEAAKYDKRDVEPRKLLLADFLDAEETSEAAHWAGEVLALRPGDPDAHYASAVFDLAEAPPKIGEAKEHLTALLKMEFGDEVADGTTGGKVPVEAGNPSLPVPKSPRVACLMAELARKSGDEPRLERVLGAVRTGETKVAADAGALDRLAVLRLRLMDVGQSGEIAALETTVPAFRDSAASLAEGDLPPNRVASMGRMLESVQKQISNAGARSDDAKAKAEALGRSLDALAEALYKKAVDPAAPPDLRIYEAYAEHLLYRQRRLDCVEIVTKALKSPMAALPTWTATTMQLRETAIKAALQDPADPKRHELAAPFIKGMLESTVGRYQGLGHLFQGVIDLEKTGLAAEANRAAGASAVAKADPKVKASALQHLKAAASSLPDVGSAQALYGIALVLSDEATLGRQYLQQSIRIGTLEPRYRIWAAWSVLQAGYPEEAQPIIEGMLSDINSGKLPRDLAGSVHLLKGEIHQAKRSPEDAKIARDEYEQAIAAGQPSTPALQLRLAQIDVLLGDSEKGSQRIEALRSDPKGGPSAERMRILLLRKQGKLDDSKQALAEARKKFPEDDDLVALETGYLIEARDVAGADRLLAEFLGRNPSHDEIAMLRSRILVSDPLKKYDEARKILAAAADRAETSAPAVQLALLEIGQQRYEAAEQAIARVRSRWKESAVGDLLEAQLSIARNNPRGAIAALAVALKKDPSNKLALFWKAQLEDRGGAAADAAKVYEEIVRDAPVKEIDNGLTLATAAQWALATQALENLDYDGAISRFEGLLKGVDTGEISRLARWRMAQARAAKGDWATAKAEVDALLSGPDVPVADRVQGANLYRLNHEDELARQQLNLVLRQEPGHSQAAAVAAYLMADQKRPKDGAAILRKAIAAKPQPPSMFLMLSAIENLTPPRETGLTRALGAIEEGLKANPDSIDMVRAKSRVTRLATEDPEKAIAVVEEHAKADQKDGRFRRLLVDVLREEGRPDRAEAVLRTLQKDFPDDPALMTTLVRMVSAQAIQAATKGDQARLKERNEETARLITAFRAKLPREISLIEAECDLWARRGDLARAKALTEQIDAIEPNSPVGPLLRAKLASVKGDVDAVASAYEDAVSRAPRRLDVRIGSARADLAAGKVDEAIRQAEHVLDADKGRVDAQVIRARALVIRPGSPEQSAAWRADATAALKGAIARLPVGSKDSGPLRTMLAEVQLRSADRAGASATLRDALKANSGDEVAVSMLAQTLIEPADPARPATQADADQATSFAKEVGDRDKKGNLRLALSVGFQKAGRVDLALPWAESAAKDLDSAIAHQNLGDILLTRAESIPESAESRAIFERALAEYDRVLKDQPLAVESTNNKAWILHRHLDRNSEALAIAEGLLARSDPSSLPAEFLDTLGAIREAAGRSKEAEAAYDIGLRKQSEHATLNYHMGRLLAKDPSRKGQAGRYLERALASRSRLAPAMADEAEALLRQVGG